MYSLEEIVLTCTGQPLAVGTELDRRDCLCVTGKCEFQRVIGFLEGSGINKWHFMYSRISLTTDPDEEDFEDEVLAALELLRPPPPPPLLLPEDMGLGIPPCGGGGPCICGGIPGRMSG